MSRESNTFKKQSEAKAFDLTHRSTIAFNMSKYEKAFQRGMQLYTDLETARCKAADIRREAINNLYNYLIQFEENATKNGTQIHWAINGKEAVDMVIQIINDHKAQNIVKSKSITTEEICLNEALENEGLNVLETDLGEYIVQLAGEKPYHILTPAMHKSRSDIAKLFHEKFDTPPDSSPEYLTNFVRKKLREQFIGADLGINGANFLIADTGSVSITENEGNGMMSFSFPETQIVVAGIDKMIPSIKQLPFLLPHLAVHGTGQHISVYNSIISGPKQKDECDGTRNFHIILLDNGRSKLLAKEHQSRALTCIRCGACLNFCPVYRNIGGYTYQVPYSGPIGSVIAQHLDFRQDVSHLSFASSLCGRCSEKCAVHIDLHKLLLYNRRDNVQQKNGISIEKAGMDGYRFATMNRFRMDLFPANWKNFAAKLFMKHAMGKRRRFPVFASSFAKQYKKERKIQQTIIT